MANYSISDLSALTGIKTHTLRVWEKRYGLLKPHRTGTNIRYYLDADLRVLMLALNLYRHGIRISRIAKMTAEEMEAESSQLSTALHDDDTGLLQSIVDMDVTAIDRYLDDTIRRHGFEYVLMHFIVPLLERMEALWLSESIGEAQETCFREILKRKTIREIDLLPHNCDGTKTVMFLPAGNRQELNHLFLHYLLRKQGLCITDMGADIHLDCACAALGKCRAECVIIVNADPVHWQFGAFVRDLVHRTSLPVIVSGRAAEEDWQQYDGRVIVMDGIEETIEYMKRLQEN